MTQFLVDASLPRSVAPLVTTLGHRAIDVRDVGLRTATDRRVAGYARENGLALLTKDHDFGNILVYPPEQYPGIVIIEPPEDAPERLILQMVRRFISDNWALTNLPGRLAVVEVYRVRFWPAVPRGG